ncbi:Mov34/MPN/PAD-1 family protein [Roseateles chitinivorans]|uniref:Mov34/MPN/PAD-1 family protein n=1 Tax=Roseateles chitinivorans TaxID=2917965 RepID=UPI003D671B65
MRSALMWRAAHAPEGQILVEADALRLMDGFWQNEHSKPESGGILLGYRRGPHLHVTMVTTPQRGDCGWRYFFKRSRRAHQDIALRHWRASGETVDYLGEWHTHPESSPTPSGEDYAEWAKICARTSLPMLFVIVGWSGQLWLGRSRGQQVPRCDLLL